MALTRTSATSVARGVSAVPARNASLSLETWRLLPSPVAAISREYVVTVGDIDSRERNQVPGPLDMLSGKLVDVVVPVIYAAGYPPSPTLSIAIAAG